MRKYRKKPVIIEAEQFLKNVLPWPEGVQKSSGDSPCEFQMETLGGIRYLNDGDWIIKSLEGCRYPCRKEIFVIYYELMPGQ